MGSSYTSSKLRMTANNRIGLIFLVLLVLFAVFGRGLVPLRDGVTLDMLLVLAVLAALIGGQVTMVATGLVWSLVRLGDLPIISTFFMQVLPLLCACMVYADWRRSFPSSRNAPYAAMTAASIVHAGLWWLFGALGNRISVAALDLFLLKGLGEALFANAVLWLVLGQLRKHHILNGLRMNGRPH